MSGLIEHQSHQASERDLPAATTPGSPPRTLARWGGAERPVVIRKRHSTRLAAALILAAVIAAGCGPSEPLRMTTLQLGRSLNPDNSVGTHTTRFKPDDTIYVSILSDQPGYGTVTVRWVLNGQVVSESKRDVSYTRAAATEFHLQNSGGFPAGNYRVEVLINGEMVGSRDFRVEG